jgi:hypothetical protein
MRIVLAGLCLIGAISSARAEWAYTTWGMSPEQVEKASKGAVHVIPEAERVTLPGANMRTEAEGTYSDGDLRLVVRFSFDPTKGDGLGCVFYGVADEKQGQALKDAMIKRYGKPVREDGIAFLGSTNLGWDKPDNIELQISKDDPAFVTHCKK